MKTETQEIETIPLAIIAHEMESLILTRDKDLIETLDLQKHLLDLFFHNAAHESFKGGPPDLRLIAMALRAQRMFCKANILQDRVGPDTARQKKIEILTNELMDSMK